MYSNLFILDAALDSLLKFCPATSSLCFPQFLYFTHQRTATFIVPWTSVKLMTCQGNCSCS